MIPAAHQAAHAALQANTGKQPTEIISALYRQGFVVVPLAMLTPAAKAEADVKRVRG
jgi:hypothetical protein